MWFCMNDGFISAVVHRDDASLLCVRARRKKDIESIFPGKEIILKKNADYKYRVVISKEEFSKIILDRIMNINYDNFKNSVPDNDLHELYGKFWSQHYMYQHTEN